MPMLWTLLAASVVAEGPAPPLPGEWLVVPELTDEFDGDGLDPTKWHDRNPEWQGRKPGWFAPHNVAVRDGMLHLTARLEDLPDLPDGYHTYTTAAVKSRVTALYGYYEIRARAMKSRASSAFWFYRHTPERWTEIDVFEIGGGAPGKERSVFMTVHVFHTPEEKEHWAKSHVHTAPAPVADDFHTYGLLWTPDRLVFYFDGEPVHELPNSHWHQALHLNFDSETMPEWFGLPEPETLPSTFSIDYVRAWRLPDWPAPQP